MACGIPEDQRIAGIYGDTAYVADRARDMCRCLILGTRRRLDSDSFPFFLPVTYFVAFGLASEVPCSFSPDSRGG